MHPEFSEFSYGYALTEALINGQQHLVRPTFPTLREEWRSGYDLKLNRTGYPLFLQFKLCQGMKRSSAKEISKFKLQLTLPFLRMPLMPSRLSPQHARLLELENFGEAVFYAAPRFFLDGDFAMNYANRTILRNSAFIQPKVIGRLPDEGAHNISFDQNAEKGWLLSEPKSLESILNGDGFQKEMENQLHDENLLSVRINTTIINAVNIISDISIDETSERDDMQESRIENTLPSFALSPLGSRDLSRRQTLHRLCLDIRRIYPEFPETDAILNTSDSDNAQDKAVSTALDLELRKNPDNSDAPKRNVVLLSNLAQIYFGATTVLICRTH